MQPREDDMTTPMLPPLRRLDLHGAVNFRDLGGYSGAGGRKVKWGQLFRSDSLAELSGSDMERLATLGLRSIFDLRHQNERNEKPNRIGQNWSAQTHAIGFYPHGAANLMERIKNRDISHEEVAETLMQAYRRLPVDQASHYASLLKKLVAPNALPALIHCTSGKDRTGFASAIVLLALGVDRDTIMTDYTLTNQFRRDLTFMLGECADPAVVRVVQGADAEYLGAAFNTIDTVWGDDSAYLREGLAFSAQEQEQLQALLLE